jgi:uncharacterized protein
MFAFLLALVTALPIPPKPAKYVTDNAHVLDAARASALNEKLAQFERDTSNQILVYVDRKLPPGATIEQMGSEAMHQWGVGQKGKGNGAALFLFIDDRKMRIEVGYGLEAALTDAKSREITSTVIKPRLKAGDYDGAVEEGTEAMLAVVRGERSKGTGKTILETRRPRAAARPVDVPRGQSFGQEALLVLLFFVLAPLAIIVFVIFFLRSRGQGSAGLAVPVAPYDPNPPQRSWPDTSYSPPDTSSGSSDSSGSGFEGGGGDAGGGGASDSW